MSTHTLWFNSLETPLKVLFIHMAYTNNPQAPKVRRDAALFAKRHGIRTAARRFGVSPGTITKWVKKLER